MRKQGPRRREPQVTRILGLLKTLSEGGKPSIHQLAARFRARRETIYRDLRVLQDIGFPIAGDAEGRLSHPRLFDQPVLSLAGFSADEIEAILWVTKQARTRGPYSETLQKVEDKIRLLGTKIEEVEKPEETLTSLEPGIPSTVEQHSITLKLVEAILRRRRCLVGYLPHSKSRAWKIEYEPHRLSRTPGAMYVIGWLPSQDRLTTLAVDRIRLVEPLGQKFTVSPAFYSKKPTQESFGIIWERPMQVVIRFRADQSPYVAEREWHPTQKIRTLRDGGLELTFNAGGLFEITRWILSWGDAAEVISPLKLRKHVAKCLKSAISIYD